MRKVNELQVLIDEIKPDIILITETWLNSSINNAAVSLRGFEIIPDLRQDREDTAAGIGGGLIVYVRDGVQAIPVQTNSNFRQHCSFTISTQGGKMTFYQIYRPPSTGRENMDELNDLVENSPPNSFIIGDFNLPGIDWAAQQADSRGRPLMEAAAAIGMEQLVEGPTHAKGNTLDLVLTNAASRVLGIEDEGRLGSSDHIMISISIEADGIVKTEDRPRLNWRRADYSAIKEELAAVDWYSEMGDLSAEDSWSFFRSRLEETTARNVPYSKGRNAAKKKWMDKSILSLLRKKKGLWKRYKDSMMEKDKKEYEKVSKEVKYAVRRAKVKAKKELAYSRDDDGKKLRRYINEKTKCRTKVGPLIGSEGTPVSDPKEMAQQLNRYFSSVFTRENLETIPSKQMETANILDTVFFREGKIREKISNLKNGSAPGPDGIGTEILKETAHIVAVPIKLIFEKSLREEKCPPDWKKANVIPIYKKGAKGKAENYRPVSLTSIVSKIMESIIKDELNSHLEINNLISDSQHGFMKGRSCTTNIVEFMEKVTRAVDQGKAVDIFYLDFAKAFDKVPRERLLEKLKAKGVGGNLLGWIRDWLTNRTQQVTCEGEYSDPTAVESGVPQGTVLGPPPLQYIY